MQMCRVEDPCARAGAAGALFRPAGAAPFGGALDVFCRTALYVTRTHGGVGGGDREVFPYPDSASVERTIQ
jgi:hypothetical protein